MTTLFKERRTLLGLDVYVPACPDQLQAEWHAARLMTRLADVSPTKEELRKGRRRLDKVMNACKDIHRLMWPGAEADDNTKAALYDKTVPTTMLVAIVTWTLSNGHVKQGPRTIAFRLLDELLHASARLGHMKLLVRPDFQPGMPLMSVDVPADSDTVFPLQWLDDSKPWVQAPENACTLASAITFALDPAKALALLTQIAAFIAACLPGPGLGYGRGDRMSGRGFYTLRKALIDKALPKVNILPLAAWDMATYMLKAKKLFGPHAQLHVLLSESMNQGVMFDGSNVQKVPIEAYSFYSLMSSKSAFSMEATLQVHEWTALELAARGIRSACHIVAAEIPLKTLEDSWLRHAGSASSFCSGCGTAELSRAVLERDLNQSEKLSFHVHIPTVAMWEYNPACHQLLQEAVHWSAKVCGRQSDPCLFGDATHVLKGDWQNAPFYSGKLQAGWQAELATNSKCLRHGCDCGIMKRPVFDVSGLPCPDMSACGKRLKRAGPTNSVYIAHGRWVTANETPLILVECTKDLDMGMLDDTHPDYDFYQLYSEPANVGFSGLSRYRTWVIGSHRRHATCLHDPYLLQNKLTDAFQKHVAAGVPDFLVASSNEIALEASVRALHLGVPYRHNQKDLRYLLNQREEACRQELDAKYMQKYNAFPCANENLVYFLGDSAQFCTWSAASNKIPTYRVNARTALYWLPSHKRWLTSKERLCSMGFPCTTEVANAMQVPLLGATDIQRASDLCGNGMHFSTCAIMQLVALSCFGPNGSCDSSG
ncbi:desi2 [Symbiodinium sp. CCMP2592]|nr:desi2 [Symbiodinium sp. CCMP2592]